MIKLKLIFVLVLCQTMILKAQIKYKCASDEELATNKKDLLKASNFQELILLQKEIKRRKADKKILDSMSLLLPELVRKEEFLKAASVKKQINEITKKEDMRILNCKEYYSAIAAEDYVKANSYKKIIIRVNNDVITESDSNQIKKGNKPLIRSNKRVLVERKENKKKNETINAKKIISYGLILGLNFATQITSGGTVKSGGKDKARGIMYGFYYGQRRLNSKWGSRIGLLYTSIKNPDYPSNEKAKFLMIPSMFEYHINKKSIINFGVQSLISLNNNTVNTNIWSSALKFGSRYHFSKRFFVETSYARGISNLIDFKDYKAYIHFTTIKIGYAIK